MPYDAVSDCVLAVRCYQTVSKLTVSLQYSMYVPYGVVPDCDLAVQYYQRTKTDCVLYSLYPMVLYLIVTWQDNLYPMMLYLIVAWQYSMYPTVLYLLVSRQYILYPKCSGRTVCSPWCCT